MDVCVKIYDRDLHQGRTWEGLWEELSHPMSVTKALQEDLYGYVTELYGCNSPSPNFLFSSIKELSLFSLIPLLPHGQPWLHILDGNPFFFQNKSFFFFFFFAEGMSGGLSVYGQRMCACLSTILGENLYSTVIDLRRQL